MGARDQIEDLMDWYCRDPGLYILGSRVYTPKIGTMNEAWFKGVHIGVLMKSRSQNNFDSAHSTL